VKTAAIRGREIPEQRQALGLRDQLQGAPIFFPEIDSAQHPKLDQTPLLTVGASRFVLSNAWGTPG